VGAVPLHGAAYRLGSAIAEGQRCGALGGVTHPPHFGQALGPGQVLDELGEHACARLDRGELVGVADEHGFGPGRRAGG
jgi:hypothetical protein